MSAAGDDAIMRLEGVGVSFPQRRGLGRQALLHAVNDVSFSLQRGEVVALVGESGSGKSTLGRAAIRVTRPTAGTIWFEGRDITALGRAELRPLRRRMQLIFQDPYGSLNPRIRIGEAIAEGIRLHGLARGDLRERVARALDGVGLRPEIAERLPAALSGGQRQRVAIARALAVEPSVVVADEPTSALDVSVQAEIIDLLKTLQGAHELAMLFISHDLRVVKDISDRVMVLYLGHVVEIGPTRRVFSAPAHPYTEALLRSVPRHPGAAAGTPIVLEGEPPNPMAPPSGCVFHPRCPHALPECRTADMRHRPVAPGHGTACIRTDLSLDAGGARR
ncbi:ABC transporter ATP-binding protein [Aquibium sp. A9E412]|uniref:ABC transporter ATP-binding protein n=1 Tax=Aquibium sp. A9E412 TaxID=2976767 RepID=UPI0025B0E4A3|nr:ABC transporter ATP-binding protein [Aquibium sp. A9E412]MDN2564857.1 ABC transporter ATP-binding protein [Aquibium sp. A9E412]